MALAIMGLAMPFAGAQSTGPSTRPVLEELNRQTVALYHEVQTGIYRVELPDPKWISAYAMAAMNRWDRALDPAVRRRLEQGLPLPIEAAEVVSGSSTRPARDSGRGALLVVRTKTGVERGKDPVLGGELRVHSKPTAGFTPNQIALLLDLDGHLLVPLYVEPEVVKDQRLKLMGPDGAVTSARFVGSDRQTNLTLLQVDKPAGKPVRLGASRPDSGSLALCLSQADGSGRLVLWTDSSDESGIIVSIDGRVCGIARSGQFLAGSACELIARRLVQYGSVRRATLGVLITEIKGDDPSLKHTTAAHARSAMRIDQVIGGSAADKAGLKPGDLVLAVGGETISDLPSFAAAIAARDGLTELQVLRGSQRLQVSVDCSSRNNPDP